MNPEIENKQLNLSIADDLRKSFEQSIANYERMCAKADPDRKTKEGYEFLIKLVLLAALLNIPAFILRHFFGDVAFIVWFVGTMLFYAGPQLANLFYAPSKTTSETAEKNRLLFHELISTPWIKHYVPSMQFNCGSKLTNEILVKSGFWSTLEKVIVCEGSFEGIFNNQQIQCFEFGLKDGNQAYLQPSYNGLFLMASCPASGTANFSISKDKLERSIGGLGVKLQSLQTQTTKGQLIRVDSELFENVFIVHSTSTENSAKLITPKFAKLLTDLRIRIGDDTIQCSLADGKLYLLISKVSSIFSVEGYSDLHYRFYDAVFLGEAIITFNKMAAEINRGT